MLLVLMFSILFNRTVPAALPATSDPSPAGHHDIACKLGFWVSSSIDYSFRRHGNGESCHASQIRGELDRA